MYDKMSQRYKSLYLFGFFIKHDGVLVVSSRENLVRIDRLYIHAENARNTGAVQAHVRRLSTVIAHQIGTDELVWDLKSKERKGHGQERTTYDQERTRYGQERTRRGPEITRRGQERTRHGQERIDQDSKE